ncbi:pseudouridine synthase [Parasphingorhabdus sp.]|uniref:pseudouridine synthase n=1 Tax=Parasphingorhabdus sp. TaxID=2709688 RepID=UPI003267BA7C
MTDKIPDKKYSAKPTPGTDPSKAPARAKEPAVREGQRIAKLLARAGVASRREIERMIEAGRISLNGDLVEHPSLLLKNLTGITVDGKPVAEPSPAKLFRFHKPNGVITAERDASGKRTIYDVLPPMERVMPIGRLDMNTEGLLLMTTDGEFKREMELPKNGIERTYRARTFGEVSQNQLEELYKGITIEGMHYGPITANLERRTGRNQWIEMTLTEGKNREVRRVLEHFGLEVSRLIRISYGPFALGDLAKGEIEAVRRHDLVKFRKSLK